MIRFLSVSSAMLVAGLGTAQTGPYGFACSATALIPTLTLSSGAPRVGTSFELTADSMTPTTPVTFWLGASRTVWAGQPLPFSLGILGRPDCNVLASIDWQVAVPQVIYRQARLTIAVPNNTALIGLEVNAQAANYLAGWSWMFTQGFVLRLQ